jgi:nicotinamidase-related amidase
MENNVDRTKIELPVRFTALDESLYEHTTLDLQIDKTAFVLVDCNGDCGDDCNTVIQNNIAPTLQSIRSVGMKAVFVYGEDRIIAPASRPAEYHEFRRGHPMRDRSIRPSQPTWADCIAPLASEPLIAKRSQNAFVGSQLDSWLRSWQIDTLITVGFSFKSCLFYTIVGAFEREYRVVFLRDGTHPPGTNEFRNTVNPDVDGGGWVRLVLTRLIEDHLGYSSTTEQLISACKFVS